MTHPWHGEVGRRERGKNTSSHSAGVWEEEARRTAACWKLKERQNAVWFLPLDCALPLSPNSQTCLQARGLSDVPDHSDVIDTAQGATVNLRKQF